MDEIETLIRQVVPVHAEIDAMLSSGLNGATYRVSWNLNDDPERPNKKSKTIAVDLPYEMVQDMPNFSATKHDQVAIRLLHFLAAKYASFDPNHNADRSTPPPVEHWIVPPSVWS